MPTTYDRDEFDEIADHGGPVGVHRAPRSVWSKVLPPVLIFVLAGAAAYGIATYLWNADTPGDPEPTVSPSVIAPPPAPSPTPSTTPSASPSPTETAEPEPVIRFGTRVTVLNGARIGGLAGRTQKELEDAAFTNVAAGNLSSNLPDENTVVYSLPDLEDTARRIAEILGVDVVEQGTPPGGAPIEVILVTDPDA